MKDLIQEFPCFSGFVILVLLVLAFVIVAAVENVLIARLKVRGITEIEKAKRDREREQDE